MLAFLAEGLLLLAIEEILGELITSARTHILTCTPSLCNTSLTHCST